jgi:GntR family transcriptional regulator
VGKELFSLDLRSRKAIYEQIADNLLELIATGSLAPDSKLPSVRELSETLTINPNTAQKAYRELESRGYVYSSPGLGTFVSPRDKTTRDDKLIASARESLRRAIVEMYRAGLDADEITRMSKEIIEGSVRDDRSNGSQQGI